MSRIRRRAPGGSERAPSKRGRGSEEGTGPESPTCVFSAGTGLTPRRASAAVRRAKRCQTPFRASRACLGSAGCLTPRCSSGAVRGAQRCQTPFRASRTCLGSGGGTEEALSRLPRRSEARTRRKRLGRVLLGRVRRGRSRLRRRRLHGVLGRSGGGVRRRFLAPAAAFLRSCRLLFAAALGGLRDGRLRLGDARRRARFRPLLLPPAPAAGARRARLRLGEALGDPAGDLLNRAEPFARRLQELGRTRRVPLGRCEQRRADLLRHLERSVDELRGVLFVTVAARVRERAEQALRIRILL